MEVKPKSVATSRKYPVAPDDTTQLAVIDVVVAPLPAEGAGAVGTLFIITTAEPSVPQHPAADCALK